ncbi:MAG: hypothetical protein ISS91_01750 [Candidatus Omnitrophica bacterium]|nr:hypothetical protein [Candidatus Omnitrophota bacterium]
MRLLRTICVMALVVGLASGAYAATQSVKISGDLEARGFFRNNWAIGYNGDTAATAAGLLTTGVNRPSQNWLMSTAEIQLDADLTDNVAAVIRLVNERDWEVTAPLAGSRVGTTNLAQNGRGLYAVQNDDQYDIGVDLAYIELREFLYSPLTLRVGRQDLWFGRGFIIGRNQRNPNNIQAPEYTAYNSFDSIRATLDYDPWTIDVVYATIRNNGVQMNADVDLIGTNIGYIFDSWNAEAESYFWYKSDKQTLSTMQANNSDVYTFGARGSFDPIENLTVLAEGAMQTGNIILSDIQIERRKRFGMAADIEVESRHFKDSFAWKPVISAEYIFYSGDREADRFDDETRARPGQTGNGNFEAPGTTGNWYTGWDPMYRGKFDTAYREFIGTYYATWQYPVRPRAYQSCADASYTNQHQAIAKATIEPMDDLMIQGKVAFFWLDHLITSMEPFRNQFVGTEFDAQLSWDYTEDVNFGLLGAWFIPGTIYDDRNNNATEVVGHVSVDF